MSVVQLDFYDREDLNGAVIFSCTDEDLFFEGFEMRIALRDLGAGHLTLSRQGVSAADNPSFLFDVARSEAFVRVLVPSISTDYLFGFFLDNRMTHVLSNEEAAGQDIILGGSGPLYYLSRAILWNEKFSGTAATVDPAEGIWRFPDNANWTPGKIFEALVAEDTNNSFRTVPALPALTLGFDNDDDSDGNAWTDLFEGGLQLAIGTHYLQALRVMQKQTADLDAYMFLGSPATPLMRLEMYNRYGRDLTGTTFGAGTVLWKGGISSDPLSGNILTGIEASGQSTIKPSHVLVRGANGVYSQVDRALWSPGDFTKDVAVDFDETAGDLSLFRYGRRVMADWDSRAEGLQFEIRPGFDEDVGHYMPGPPASDGHFWIGDDITVKTGGDAVFSVLDYDYTTERVTGIRMVLDEAVRDDNDEMAALSWHVVPELNETFGMEGSLTSGGDLNSGVGLCCAQKPAPTPAQCEPGDCIDTFTRSTSSLGTSEINDVVWSSNSFFTTDGDEARIDTSPFNVVRTTNADFGVTLPFDMNWVQFWDALPGVGGLVVAGFALNNTGSDSTTPYAYFSVLPSGAVTLNLGVNGSNVQTPSGLTISAGERLHCRFRVETTHVYAKVWLDAGSEPGTWLDDAANTLVSPDRLVMVGQNAASATGGDTFIDDQWITEGVTCEDCPTTQPVGGDGDADAGVPDGTYVGPAHVHEHSDQSAKAGSLHEVTQLVTSETDTTLVAAPDGGGGVEFRAETSGAPDDATYLVTTAHAGLSAEVAVGATPGGELGGTWATPTVDATHSGTSHTGIISTHEGAADPHTGYVREADASWIDLTDSGATTLHTHAGAAHNHVYSEVPGGTVDGANDDFTLAATPTGGTLRVYKNGLRQKAGAGNDYTLATATITFEAGNIPQTGDTLLADYEA